MCDWPSICHCARDYLEAFACSSTINGAWFLTQNAPETICHPGSARSPGTCWGSSLLRDPPAGFERRDPRNMGHKGKGGKKKSRKGFPMPFPLYLLPSIFSPFPLCPMFQGSLPSNQARGSGSNELPQHVPAKSGWQTVSGAFWIEHLVCFHYCCNKMRLWWIVTDADAEGAEQGDDASDEEAEFDWHIEQEPFSATALPLDAPKYGFANQRCGVLQRLQVWTSWITAYLLNWRYCNGNIPLSSFDIGMLRHIIFGNYSVVEIVNYFSYFLVDINIVKVLLIFGEINYACITNFSRLWWHLKCASFVCKTVYLEIALVKL